MARALGFHEGLTSRRREVASAAVTRGRQTWFGHRNLGGQFFLSASVLGYASSAGVTLVWSEHVASGHVHRTVVHAVLYVDGRTLSGTMTVNNGPTGAFGYGRATAGTPGVRTRRFDV